MTESPREPIVEIEGTTYVVPPTIARHIEELQNAWERAEAHANYLASELRWCSGRIGRGEFDGRTEQESFDQALAATGRASIPEGSRDSGSSQRTAGAFAIGLAIGAGIVALFAGIGMLVQA